MKRVELVRTSEQASASLGDRRRSSFSHAECIPKIIMRILMDITLVL